MSAKAWGRRRGKVRPGRYTTKPGVFVWQWEPTTRAELARERRVERLANRVADRANRRDRRRGADPTADIAGALGFVQAYITVRDWASQVLSDMAAALNRLFGETPTQQQFVLPPPKRGAVGNLQFTMPALQPMLCRRHGVRVCPICMPDLLPNW